jgi:hypothetical protein
MGKDLEGNGHGIFQNIVPAFFGLRKTIKKLILDSQ